jgi:hypothetical protein
MLKNTPKKAARYARVLVDDIVLYNENQVDQALKDDTVFDALADLFKEGRDTFISNVSPELLEGPDYFSEAIVNKLLHRKRALDCHLWD